MTFSIQSVEHGLATVAADIVKGAKKLASVIGRVQGSETAIEALTGAIDPAAVPVERAAFACLGVILKAVSDFDVAAGAAAAGKVDISLDTAFVAELKGILPAIKQAAAAQGFKL